MMQIATKSYRRRDQILAAVGNAATRLMIGDDPAADINSLLEDLGKAMDVCRVYIFEQHRDANETPVISQRYEWTREGVSKELENQELQSLPCTDPGFARMVPIFESGGVVLGNVGTFEPTEREMLEAQGILSILLVPIAVRSRWWGFIGFDECRATRSWESSDIDALRIAAGLVGASLCRQRTQHELAMSEARFRALFDNMPSVAVQGYTSDGTIHYWNKACETTYGYTADEATGQDLVELIIPPDMQDMVRSAIQNGAATGIMPPPDEHELLRKDGKSIPVLSSHACISVPGQPVEMFCIDVDLTSLKNAQEDLRRREEEFVAMAENSPDVIMRFDRDCRHLYVNPAVTNIVDIPPEKWIGKTHADLGFPEEQCSHWEQCITNVFETAKPYREEFSIHTPSRELIIDWQLIPEMSDGSPVNTVLSVSRDITCVKEAHKELADSREQIRRLRQHTEHIREDEQKRIAQRIHDDFGQRLTTLTMDLTWLKNEFSQIHKNGHSRLDADLKIIDELLTLARDISKELRPAVLEHFGLSAALEWIAEGLESSSAISVELDLDEEPRLGQSLQLALYRIAQELLTNIARHADATNVMITLLCFEDTVQLAVADDGIGMQTTDLLKMKTMGLPGIRETAVAVGGQVDIESLPGHGTTVLVTTPFVSAERDIHDPRTPC